MLLLVKRSGKIVNQCAVVLTSFSTYRLYAVDLSKLINEIIMIPNVSIFLFSMKNYIDLSLLSLTTYWF